MRISKKRVFQPHRYPAIVLPFFRRAGAGGLVREFPELAEGLKRFKIRGLPGHDLVFYSAERQQWLAVIGAGEPGSLNEARKLAKRIAGCLRENRLARALVGFLQKVALDRDYLINLIDYLLLNDYRFDRYRKKKEKGLQQLDLFSRHQTAISSLELRQREMLDPPVRLVRDLVNETPAKVNPDSLVAALAEVAGRNRSRIQVLRRRELEKRGYRGLLAVGGAGCCEPALVTLTYAPTGFRRTVALVGKGITFDSGGLNIKIGKAMEEMKCDMAGAALVAGVLQAVAQLRLPIRLIGLAAIAENMPGRAAYKPGDVITYANGKTVEIVNTDAEGRLILADALIEASRLKPDCIVEFSTLTGAIVTALGDSFAGLMTRNRRLASQLLAAGERCGEFLWELPLFEEYRENIGSTIADLKNANYEGASSLKAGLFLAEFTGRVPFAHIDIAGTAFLSKANHYFSATGATGFGVRLMIEFLRSLL